MLFRGGTTGRWLMLGRVAATAATASAVFAGASATAVAAPSIETIKFVSVYQPPGGGALIRRETPGPEGGVGLTQLNVDEDAAADLTANVGLSFDATELTVAGQLQIARSDFGGVLGPTGLAPLPLSVEAVAVLKDTVAGEVVRKHVSLGYDALASNAPGRFNLDLGSCSTPNCQATPTPCSSPCEGTKTTLSMNVAAPGGSMKLTGELADHAPDGRKNPTRAELEFAPVPGSSSPLVLTVWGTETKASAATDAPVATLTHLSMTGNKEAGRAAVHVCRLPGETYQARQIGHTACDAAGYTDRQYDSRIVDATLDPVPRDVATGNAGIAVSVADNDLDRAGGRQTIAYQSTHAIDRIDVVDRVVTWTNGSRREGDRTYRLRGVPKTMTLDLHDTSDLPTTDDAVTDLQTVTYDAAAGLTSVEVASAERIDGALTERENLLVEGVPTHLKVVSESRAERQLLPGTIEPGFDRRTRQKVGLVEASSPIGTIEYTSANGETTAAPPADIGDVYVYTNKPSDGVQFVKVRLRGAQQGDFTIGRHERREPRDFPWEPAPETESGLDLLAVNGSMAPAAFRARAEDGDRVFDVRVNDLPGTIGLVLQPESGKIDYTGSGPINSINVHAADPNGLFARANTLDVLLEGLPTELAVQYPSEASGDLDLQVAEGEIGKVELTALGAGDAVPGDIVGPEDDGLIVRDLQGLDDVEDAYVMFARVRGLRHVRYEDVTVDRNQATQQEIARKHFGLDTTSGRIFVVDVEKTGEKKEYIWREGDGYDWSDDDSRCETKTVGKQLERTRAVITGISPATDLTLDKRKSFGKRECFENAYVFFPSQHGQIRIPYDKNEVSDIRYTAASTTPELQVLTTDPATNMYVRLDTVPTRLRFCKAHGHECLPTIGDGYGTSLGSLTLDADDYVTVHLVDCKAAFEPDGSCDTANTRITDLRLKQIDFWGDLDGVIDGTNGDIYFNTADYDYGAPIWNGLPWDEGPFTGHSQPFADAGSGRPARIKVKDVDFRFGTGFYARGAHIYWDWIADDEIGDWAPDGTGGSVYCPSGTFWEVDAGFPAGWVEVHEDWCTAGAAN